MCVLLLLINVLLISYHTLASGRAMMHHQRVSCCTV